MEQLLAINTDIVPMPSSISQAEPPTIEKSPQKKKEEQEQLNDVAVITTDGFEPRENPHSYK